MNVRSTLLLVLLETNRLFMPPFAVTLTNEMIHYYRVSTTSGDGKQGRSREARGSAPRSIGTQRTGSNAITCTP